MLLGVSVAFMLVVIAIANLKIAKPARNASRELNQIVDKIVDNKGDLTERIIVNSKDEIGQLAEGINVFMGELQRLMQNIQVQSENMLTSATTISGQVDESSQSALNVSGAMKELTTSIQEIDTILTQIANGSNDVLELVKCMDTSIESGSQTVDTIKVRAIEMHKDTQENKDNAVKVLQQIPASITVVEFYKKQGYDYKNGVNELDDEGHYRLEKNNVKKGVD